MGIFDWFSALSKGNEHAAKLALPETMAGSIQATANVNGLDFVAAIEAHRKWRKRLDDFVEGTTSESLDSSVICRDDQCALGKWIYADGNTFLGHLPLFHKLKAEHAGFHICAAEVVDLSKEGKKDVAKKMIFEGDFAKRSRDVQTILSQLYMKLKNNDSA